ncbi:MAG: hypothetical protein ACOVP1_04970 [Bacteroidia bacterium]
MNFKSSLTFALTLVLIICHSLIHAQVHNRLIINKINSKYTKTLKLPLNARIVTFSDEVIIIKIDSISNGKIYGNKGKDSLKFETIKCIHTRGAKEFIKYSALGASSIIAAGALYFSIYAFNYPVFIDSPNGAIAYISLAYSGFFAGISTYIYHYPRTKFLTKKYQFKTK